MSKSPGGGTLKLCPQIQLIIIFVSLCHFEIQHCEFQHAERIRDEPSRPTSGITVKSSYPQTSKYVYFLTK